MIIERVLTSRAVLALGITVTIGLAAACKPAPANPPASGARAAAASAAAAPVSLDRGRDLYKVHCAPCHGEKGHGDGPAAAGFNPKPRNHADAAYMRTLTDEDIGKVIQYGGAIKGMPMMPSNPVLKGADLQSVISYTRSLSAAESTGTR